MTFPIDTTIPAANNDPADDQPLMLQNFININSYVQVDHTNPANIGAGQHKYVTFNNKNTPGSPVDPTSSLYTFSGTASTVSQLAFKNQNTTVPISILRAFGFANSSGIITSQSYNVASLTRVSTGIYNVTLTSGAVSSSNFAVIVSQSYPNRVYAREIFYIITGVGTFELHFNTSTDPTNFSFVVYQL